MSASVRPPSGTPSRTARLWLALAGTAGLGLVAAATPAPPRSPYCTPQYPIGIACVKSVSVTKAVPATVLVGPAGTTFDVLVTVNTDSGPQPGFACAMAAAVVGGMITIDVCDAGGATIATNTIPIPARPAGFQSETYEVPITLPAGTPPGEYDVKGTVPIQFDVDSTNPPQTISGGGDTKLCVAEAAPQDPSLPRLALETISRPLVNCPPGAQFHQVYRVRNNDPVHAVSLQVEARSRQNAVMPVPDPSNPGMDSAFSISAPSGGDDFPIEFVELLPPDGVLPLPPNPPGYVQMPLMKAISIPPGGTEIVEVATRSYPGCSDGSCSEYVLLVVGTFANGDPAAACVGGGLNVVAGDPQHLPTFYCTGKTASTACIPFLTTDANSASVTSPFPWNVRANDHVDGEAGFLIYSFQKSNLNFHGGKLCVKAPFTRTPVAKSKQAPCLDPFTQCGATTCSQLRRNFNATVQSGNDPGLTAGRTVRAQMFQRDPADPQGFGDNFSDGVSFTIAP